MPVVRLICSWISVSKFDYSKFRISINTITDGDPLSFRPFLKLFRLWIIGRHATCILYFIWNWSRENCNITNHVKREAQCWAKPSQTARPRQGVGAHSRLILSKIPGPVRPGHDHSRPEKGLPIIHSLSSFRKGLKLKGSPSVILLILILNLE